MRWKLRGITLLFVLAPFACKRVPEPTPNETDAASMEKLLAFANETGAETLSAMAAQSTSAVPSVSPAALASASALLAAFASASAIPSASTSASAFASIASSASASSSGSASAPPVPLSPLATKLLGTWIFTKFDLTDASTAAKWKAVPEPMQKEILKEAPKASIEFTSTHIVSRLSGVPDKKSTWSVESEADGEITIKTSDDGRKKLKFVGDDLRIVDIDKKDAFVSLFARKPK
ncbi:MAG: hypothetical protein ACXVEF_41055 [Polyangiales bacterium]